MSVATEGLRMSPVLLARGRALTWTLAGLPAAVCGSFRSTFFS